MEGKGFEPAAEALFGKNGFFPDAVSKALYWAEDKMSPKIKEVLDKWTAPLKMEGQKVRVWFMVSPSASFMPSFELYLTWDSTLTNPVNVTICLQAHKYNTSVLIKTSVLLFSIIVSSSGATYVPL